MGSIPALVVMLSPAAVASNDAEKATAAAGSGRPASRAVSSGDAVPRAPAPADEAGIAQAREEAYRILSSEGAEAVGLMVSEAPPVHYVRLSSGDEVCAGWTRPRGQPASAC